MFTYPKLDFISALFLLSLMIFSYSLIFKEMPQKSQIFLRYVHNFRGLAIIQIVIGHTVFFINQKDLPQLPYFIHVLTNGTVYFIFIAGFLFQSLLGKYQYKSYLSKKFFNVIIPYFIVSIPAVLICLWRNQPYATTLFTNAFSEWSILEKTSFLYVTGSHSFQFWFIPMMVIYYLLAPVFVLVDRHPKIHSVLLLFLLTISLIIPKPIYNESAIQSSIHFLSIYLLGMLCCRYKEDFFTFLKRSWLILTLVVIALVILESFLQFTSSPLLEVFYINTLTKAILSVLLIYFLWRFDSVLPNKIHSILGTLADLSFGIYFLHGYFLWGYASAVKRLDLLSWLNQTTLISFITFFLVVMTCTTSSLILIRRLFRKNSRYIVGC